MTDEEYGYSDKVYLFEGVDLIKYINKSLYLIDYIIYIYIVIFIYFYIYIYSKKYDMCIKMSEITLSLHLCFIGLLKRLKTVYSHTDLLNTTF